MTTLFVDTSAWVALFDRTDKYHAPAADAFRSLQSSQLQLITSDYILDETLTLLRYRCSHSVAVAFGNWVQSAKIVEIVSISPELWQESWRLFEQYSDKVWAFTDCTSFAFMRQSNLTSAFTFDHHFEQAGLMLWPTA